MSDILFFILIISFFIFLYATEFVAKIISKYLLTVKEWHISFICLILLCISLGGIVYTGLTTHYEPYPSQEIVTIDNKYNCKIIMCRYQFDYNIESNTILYGTNNKTLFDLLYQNSTYCFKIANDTNVREIGEMC